MIVLKGSFQEKALSLIYLAGLIPFDPASREDEIHRLEGFLRVHEAVPSLGSSSTAPWLTRLAGRQRLNQETAGEGSNLDEPEILYRGYSCFDGF